MTTVARKTLSLGSKARKPPRPQGGSLVGVHEDWMTIRYSAARGPELAQDIGNWLLEHGLHSKGNDFTSEWSKDPDHVGNSTLAKIWEGSACSLDEIYNHTEVWVLLKKGKPQGVVAWVHPRAHQQEWFPQDPGNPRHKPKSKVSVGRLGYVMAFINPQFRGIGLLRETLSRHVLPEIEHAAQTVREQGAIPLLGGGDAMFEILRNYSSIPLTSHMDMCRAMRSDLWQIITRRRMWPEKVDQVDKYLVSPVPFSEIKTKRRTCGP